MEGYRMPSTRAGFELGSVTNQPDSEAYRFEYDQETTPASMAVVVALSEAIDVDPLDLEPLNESVDTDALDALVRVRGAMNGDVHVTFTHEERVITISSYGVIAVTPPGNERTDGQHTGIPHR